MSTAKWQNIAGSKNFLGKVKDPRYMQNKKDSRISLVYYIHGKQGEVGIIFLN